MEIAGAVGSGIWELIKALDWLFAILLFILCFYIFRSAWGFWREESYKNSRAMLPWVFFEIKVPREVLKGPKAMEQFFQSIGALKNGPKGFGKKWWEGEVCRWHVIDIVGTNNSVRFYVRTSSRISEAFAGLLYAQYPEIEIVESEDYFPKEFPATYNELSDQGYEIWGNELFQTHNPAISIRVYSEFEQESGDEKGRIIDPFSTLLELIGNLKPDEKLLIQFVIVPDIHHHWEHGADHLLEKYRDTTQQIGHDNEGKPQYKFRFRTPAEESTIKRIEDKLERANFETTIRYMYLAPKGIFNFNVGYRGVQTFFNQFRHDKQTLERNYEVMTKTEWYYFPWFFNGTRGYYRRKVFYDEFKNRFQPEETIAGKLYNSYFFKWCFHHKPCILSSEELATLIHIPTNVVLTQSTMDRIESKRLATPSNLPS